MNERTTLEIIAPTVEEALAQGLAQLGLPAEAVSVEVLDAGTRGLFGLGGRQVRVRLTVNPPGGPPPRPPLAAEEPKRTSSAEKPKGRAKREPAGESAGRRSKPARTAEPRPAARGESLPEGQDAVLESTEAIISKLLFHMGLEAQVSAHYGEVERDDRRPIMVDIRGEDLGVLIGRRGEMLNAFQYVAALMVGKETGQFIHLVVDVEGHRDRRERQLRQLARRMAEQVIKSGRKLTLEPMTPAERRIIHIELREHPAVKTESSGEEPHRKITILLKE
jgi:spoIIIJ-associated protein